MTDRIIWDEIREGFGRSEAWGDPDKINGALLWILFSLRQRFLREGDVRFIIHNAYEGRSRNSKSQHPLGNAVDFHIKTTMNFEDQVSFVLEVLKDLQVANHVGLGIYLDWDNKGFHLDVRGTKARWSRVEGEYLSFDRGLEVA